MAIESMVPSYRLAREFCRYRFGLLGLFGSSQFSQTGGNDRSFSIFLPLGKIAACPNEQLLKQHEKNLL
jgi:hypothetical protein